MYLAQYFRGNEGPVMTRHLERGNDWVHPVMSLIFFLVLVGLAVYVVKVISKHYSASQTEVRDPLDIARERYAKGEITKDELAEIKKELK